MELSVLIVNWNSCEYLAKCLESLQRQRPAFAFEVVVVDNGSFDGCAALLGSHFPTVKFVQSHQNLGFAGANNLAFEQSQGDYLLFLNPDTELPRSALQSLVDFARAHPEMGAAGPKLLNSDGTLQTTCVQAFPTLANQLLDAQWLRRWFPRSRLWGTAVFDRNPAEPHPVAALCGACLLMARTTFGRLGRMNTDYFMYAEDVDLCHRAARKGLVNYYLPYVEVVHHGGKSTQDKTPDAFASMMLKESRFKFFRQTRGAVYAWLFRLLLAPVCLLRLLLIGLGWLISADPSARHQWRARANKWSAILRWTFGAAPPMVARTLSQSDGHRRRPGDPA